MKKLREEDATIPRPRGAVRQIDRGSWTGPNANDLMPRGDRLCRPVPAERWPHGPPSAHEPCCRLHAQGLFCDCRASDAGDAEWGVAP